MSESSDLLKALKEAYNQSPKGKKYPVETDDDLGELFESSFDGYEYVTNERHNEDYFWVFKWKGELYKAECSYYSHYGPCYDNIHIRKVSVVIREVVFYE